MGPCTSPTWLGGVFARLEDGTVNDVIPGRPRVGGLALHADGGLVVSGENVAHWRDGVARVLLEREDVSFWNDLQPDPDGRIYVGSVRRDISRSDAESAPGECYRIGIDGAVEELYGGLEVSNGIATSPDGSVLYHCDSIARGVWVHDLSDRGIPGNRRLIGAAQFVKGVPDGLCVDSQGDLWIAHVGGRRVVHLDRCGAFIGQIPVPAKAVTSVSFGGPNCDQMIIATADNLVEPSRKGSLFRTDPGVTGLPTPMARIRGLLS